MKPRHRRKISEGLKRAHRRVRRQVAARERISYRNKRRPRHKRAA